MRNRAFTVMEYMSLIAILTSALIGMQVYTKRSIQGRLRGAMQDLNGGLGYSPGATESRSTITKKVTEHAKSSTVRDELKEKWNKSEVEGNIEQTTQRYEETLPFASEPQRF